MVLLELLEHLDHATEKGNGGLESRHVRNRFDGKMENPSLPCLPSNAQKQVQRVVERINSKVLTIKVLER